MNQPRSVYTFPTYVKQILDLIIGPSIHSPDSYHRGPGSISGQTM